MNQLILGDTQNVLAVLEPKSIDLTYIDLPEYFSDHIEITQTSKITKKYQRWLSKTLKQTLPLLKDTASVFINVPTLLKDSILEKTCIKHFKQGSYKGEIRWEPPQTDNSLSVTSSLTNSTILYFSVTDTYTCNYPYNERYLHHVYQHKDKKGCYRLASLTSSHANGFFYEYKGYRAPENGWSCSEATLEEWDALGLLHIPENKEAPIRLKKYYIAPHKNQYQVSPFNISKKGFVYRSKNPSNLLRRIVQYASNEGDTLLNINVHNGSTLKVADQHKRFWIGVDNSVEHIKSTEYQLNKDNSRGFSLRIYQYEPYTRLYSEADSFETWLKRQFQPELMEDASVILKCNDKVGLFAIDHMVETCVRPYRKKWFKHTDSKRFHGILVGNSFSKYAFEEVKRLYTYENIRLKLVTLNDLTPTPLKPEIQYSLKQTKENGQQEVSFSINTSNSKAVAFYSWDLNYNESDKVFRPEVILKEQPELTYSFAPGQYTVALQTTQKDGLSSLQTLTFEVKNTLEEKIAS